jgi:MoxR-like ATPase
MNFPHETENSYLSGGNCLNLGVNPSGEVYFKEFLYLCLLLTTHEIIRHMKSIKSHITQLLKSLNEGVFEKEHTIALSLLSAMAGESIFLLGPPGVAKSLVARRLKLAFKDADAFEYLMSRFSTPDEIFGPVSISKLKDEDTYERITKGYLPTASIVFLDEIWKAGPAIQNSLLTVINEKIYRNGQFTVRVPLKALIAASNELPAKGEGLEALYDRFLIRQFVGCIEQEYAFDQMISSTREIEPEIPEKLQVNDELYNQIQAESEKVGIHYTIFELIHNIKREIEQYNTGRDENTPPIYVSDRRWKKIVGLLRTSAYLNEFISPTAY